MTPYGIFFLTLALFAVTSFGAPPPIAVTDGDHARSNLPADESNDSNQKTITRKDSKLSGDVKEKNVSTNDQLDTIFAKLNEGVKHSKNIFKNLRYIPVETIGMDNSKNMIKNVVRTCLLNRTARSLQHELQKHTEKKQQVSDLYTSMADVVDKWQISDEALTKISDFIVKSGADEIIKKDFKVAVKNILGQELSEYRKSFPNGGKISPSQ